jgi:CPA2 family monovalent cation:H+ antiporter-2
MDQQLDIVVDLVAALAVAFAGGWLAARLRVSPIFGYVVAGLVISPFTPGFVGDTERLRFLGDIGVVLLLFGIGIQFSVRDLLRASRAVGGLAAVQIAGSLALGYVVGRALGFDSLEAVFFGAAISLSSTAVISKILAERNDEGTAYGRIAIAWGLVQDLGAVLLIVLLTVAAESDAGPGQLALSGLKTAGFVGGVLVVGLRVVPWALEQVLAVQSREVFLLAIATLALGTAAAAASLDISLALGAFLAGVLVSEWDRSHEVLHEVLPIRDLFAVLFFVVVGMLVDPAQVVRNPDVFAAALGLIVLAKFALVALPLLLIRSDLRTTLLAAVLLASSAEFTFLILQEGVSDGAVRSSTFDATVAAMGVSVLLTPLLVMFATRREGAGEPVIE